MIDALVSVEPGQLAVIQKGKAYEVLATSEGYRLLLDFMERYTSNALKALSDCEDGEDRKKLDLMLAWRSAGRLFDDVQREVQRGIENGREALRDLSVDRPEEAMTFGFGDNDDE